MIARILGLSAMFLMYGPAHAAPKCFCRALCIWNGSDASDFHVVKDVPCDQSMQTRKALVAEELKAHLEQKHDSSLDGAAAKTEIKCYTANTKKDE